MSVFIVDPEATEMDIQESIKYSADKAEAVLLSLALNCHGADFHISTDKVIGLTSAARSFIREIKALAEHPSFEKD